MTLLANFAVHSHHRNVFIGYMDVYISTTKGQLLMPVYKNGGTKNREHFRGIGLFIAV
jgi:hypothetical protein